MKNIPREKACNNAKLEVRREEIQRKLSLCIAGTIRIHVGIQAYTVVINKLLLRRFYFMTMHTVLMVIT